MMHQKSISKKSKAPQNIGLKRYSHPVTTPARPSSFI